MSWWDRLKGKLGGEAEPEGEAGAEKVTTLRTSEAPAAAAPPPEEEAAPPGPEATLTHMATEADAVHPTTAFAAFEQLVEEGRTATALSLGRAVLAHGLPAPELRFAVSETLAMRGDDDGALEQLRPLLRERAPSLESLSLAAEIHERRGEDGEALLRTQQILARDVAYPRAEARLRRLLDRQARPVGALGGATLATDGALARGRYQVEAELGRGGAGTVFAAMDVQLGRRVALKVYHGRGVVERERLLVEARVPARFEHPGVVRIFDVDDALLAIAMEVVEGGSVRRELNREAVTTRRLLRWWRTAVDALTCVHEAGVVHRDIKPSNFLLRQDDRVVLTDFGLAAEVGVAPSGGRGEGTLQYMAPEQGEGAPAHPAMDVHALGKSMLELIPAAGGDWPEALTSVAAACTRASPAARPSLAEVAEALDRASD